MRLLLPVLLVALSAAAQPLPHRAPQGPLARALTGEWYNIYLHLRLSSGQIIEADSSNWQVKLGIKPIHTFFKGDGSYYSEYRNLRDSVVRRPSGHWNTEGDTLTMWEQSPDSSPIRVHVTMEGDVATFSGLIDFDGEGKNNDEYLGKQRKKAGNP